ncbi:hypothetical protein [Candidatus Protochlamydia amoebophila]|uniref:Uncharacterized protein n=1 Tax=Candidatus Protochlamydia amoebophila TaxID=362787 RepID=A0A0C1H838_9BACT|nr:hypothetical protein [Candidatus Protochlamydia amoebophila]KIC71058.1 hypothetical protein DB44_EV00010 [Candidatus Protochlamydia amoebophila]
MEPSSRNISCGSSQTWVPITAQEAADLKVQVRSHVQSYVGHLRELNQLEAREVQLQAQKKQIHAEVLVAKQEALVAQQNALVAKQEALVAKQEALAAKEEATNAVNLLTAKLFYGVF